MVRLGWVGLRQFSYGNDEHGFKNLKQVSWVNWIRFLLMISLLSLVSFDQVRLG